MAAAKARMLRVLVPDPRPLLLVSSAPSVGLPSDLWSPNPFLPALRILASATYCADTTVFIHPATPRRATKRFCPHNESASPRTVMEGVGGEGAEWSLHSLPHSVRFIYFGNYIV